jgi:hypothetical protein
MYKSALIGLLGMMATLALPQAAQAEYADGNKITMAKIIDGKFCGACHNGEISWSVENCGMCHSGVPGTPTQIHGSTVQRLVAPTYKSLGKKAK